MNSPHEPNCIRTQIIVYLLMQIYDRHKLIVVLKMKRETISTHIRISVNMRITVWALFPSVQGVSVSHSEIRGF